MRSGTIKELRMEATGVFLMIEKLFILGLPGSGKSAIVRFISSYVRDYPWKVCRFNDHTNLDKMFRQDSARRFKPADLGGFDVLDTKVFDEALQDLEQDVTMYIDSLRPEEKKLVLIEFSRNNYEHALQQFSKSFLKDAYFLYLDTDLERCKQRIRHRVANPQFEEDDFNVSDYIFEKYYNKDNGECIVDVLKSYGVNGQHVRSIDNNYSCETASLKVEPFIQQILKEASQEEEADKPKDSLEVSKMDAYSLPTSLDKSVLIK